MEDHVAALFYIGQTLDDHGGDPLPDVHIEESPYDSEDLMKQFIMVMKDADFDRDDAEGIEWRYGIGHSGPFSIAASEALRRGMMPEEK